MKDLQKIQSRHGRAGTAPAWLYCLLLWGVSGQSPRVLVVELARCGQGGQELSNRLEVESEGYTAWDAGL